MGVQFVNDALSTFQLDPRSGLGIAAQIRTRIALQIADGELVPGDRLPSVRALAGVASGVNANTIRAAYARLRDGRVGGGSTDTASARW